MKTNQCFRALKPGSVRENFIYLLAGNGFTLLGQFSMLWFLHRFSTINDVGRFMLGLGVTAPIILFTGLGLMQVQGTDAAERFSFGHYLGTRHITNSVAMVATLLIAALFGIGSKTFWVILLVGLMKCAEHISNVMQGFFYRIEQMKYVACSRMLHGFVGASFFGISLALTNSVIIGLIFVSLGYVGVAYSYDVVIASRYTKVKSHFARETLWHLGKKAFPLAIVAGVNSVNSNLYRYVLVAYLDVAAVGIFGTMSYVIVALNQFCIALSHSALPRMARYHEEANNQYFIKLLFKLVGLNLVFAGVTVLLTVFFGQFFLSIFAPELRDYSDVFLIVVLGGVVLFMAGMLGDVLIACQRFGYRAVSVVVSIMVGIGAAVCMIPRWGIAGAAWASLMSNAVRTIAIVLLLLTVVRNMYVGFVNQKRL